MGIHTRKNHATCTVYRVWSGQCTPNLSHACDTCRSHQHWYLQPQRLPTACILSDLLGFMAPFKRPAAPKSQHSQHHMACLSHQFPSSHHTYEVPAPLQNLRYVKGEQRNPTVRPEKNCPKPFVAGGKATKPHPKITVISNPPKHASRRHGRHPV